MVSGTFGRCYEMNEDNTDVGRFGPAKRWDPGVSQSLGMRRHKIPPHIPGEMFGLVGIIYFSIDAAPIHCSRDK